MLSRVQVMFNCVIHRVFCWLVLLGVHVAVQAAGLNPITGVGSCIWDSAMYDRQECKFVRAFKIPRGAKVTSARLRITADNSYKLFIDGQPIGQGSDWRVLIEYDVRLLLAPGEHLLAVSAVNDFAVAGLVVGLRITFADGSEMEIPSDDTWRIAPKDNDSWKTASQLDWRSWPSATLRPPLNLGDDPGVYFAPMSSPVMPAFWQRKEVQFFLLAFAIIGIPTGVFLVSRLILKSQMEKVVRHERTRIALDLHDNLGGGLTQLVLWGETSRQTLPHDSAASEALGRLCDQSRELMLGMNETVWLIDSQRDTVADFVSYVARFTEIFFQGSSIRCRFDIEQDLPPFSCDIGIRRNLFLAIKESINNVLRHSGASLVELSIRRQRNELVVVVSDDGHGFDSSAVSKGNGLHSMETRAAEAGGRLSVHSRPGQGCTLQFYIPLQTFSGLHALRHFSRFLRLPFMAKRR